MGSDEEDQDMMEKMYWKYINPRWTDVDSSLTCPKCGSRDLDHTRGYRGEYTCRACKKRWKAR
jgi:transposase